jgi:flavin prenyltransferase
MNAEKKYIVAITGASGSIYGIRLIKVLLEHSCEVIVIVSDSGLKVMAHEMGIKGKEPLSAFLESYGVDIKSDATLCVYSERDIAVSPASGSFQHDGMAVVPCSMKTLAAVSQGFADNLITRSCDVCLKEKNRLVMVPRETPFNLIHLENMTRLCKAGAVILPPSPSFYTFPENLEQLADTIVSRILDHLGVEHELIPRWIS